MLVDGELSLMQLSGISDDKYNIAAKRSAVVLAVSLEVRAMHITHSPKASSTTG